MQINYRLLAKWLWTLSGSAIGGGLQSAATIVALMHIPETQADFNLVDQYNVDLVWSVAVKLFVIGCVITLPAVLMKSPLHFDEVFPDLRPEPLPHVEDKSRNGVAIADLLLLIVFIGLGVFVIWETIFGAYL